VGSGGGAPEAKDGVYLLSENIKYNSVVVGAMKKVDDTPLPESESEDLETICALLYPQVSAFIEMNIHPLERLTRQLVERIEALEAEVADLHHRRRVSRQQAVDQDPEWH